MSRVDCYLVKRALTLREADCGDTGVIKEFDGQCFLALVDVLGHGSEAHDVALIAQKYLEQNYCEELVDVMQGLHACLKGTRGAVAALCRLDTETGELIYVGIGNITVRVLGSKDLPVCFRRWNRRLHDDNSQRADLETLCRGCSGYVFRWH